MGQYGRTPLAIAGLLVNKTHDRYQWTDRPTDRQNVVDRAIMLRRDYKQLSQPATVILYDNIRIL